MSIFLSNFLVPWTFSLLHYLLFLLLSFTHYLYFFPLSSSHYLLLLYLSVTLSFLLLSSSYLSVTPSSVIYSHHSASIFIHECCVYLFLHPLMFCVSISFPLPCCTHVPKWSFPPILIIGFRYSRSLSPLPSPSLSSPSLHSLLSDGENWDTIIIMVVVLVVVMFFRFILSYLSGGRKQCEKTFVSFPRTSFGEGKQ